MTAWSGTYTDGYYVEKALRVRVLLAQRLKSKCKLKSVLLTDASVLGNFSLLSLVGRPHADLSLSSDELMLWLHLDRGLHE